MDPADKMAVVCLSGGMDSATLLPYAIENYGRGNVVALSFNYGSKHNKYELEMARKLTMQIGVVHRVVDLPFVPALLSSSLLIGGGDIPEGHYEDPSMKETIVPGRNLIMLSIASAVAESSGGGTILMGMHAGDAAIYPDCRPAFVSKVQSFLRVSTVSKVWFYAPFLKMDKTAILMYGYDRGVPYALTRTCYKYQELACGRCGACIERLEAFANIGKTDPLPYATL